MGEVPPPPPIEQTKKRPSRRILAAILVVVLFSVVVVATYAVFLQPKKHGTNESWLIFKSDPYPAYPANADQNFSNSEFFSIDKDTPKIDIKIKFLAAGLYPYIQNEAALQNELRIQMDLRQTSINNQIIATLYCYPTVYWHEDFEGVVRDVPISSGEFYFTFYTPNAQYPRNWYHQFEIWGHY